MIARIRSARLGREILLIETPEEARRVWSEKPERRSDIYLFSEIDALRVDSGALEFVQMVKDAMPGSSVEAVEILQPEAPQQPDHVNLCLDFS